MIYDPGCEGDPRMELQDATGWQGRLAPSPGPRLGRGHRGRRPGGCHGGAASGARWAARRGDRARGVSAGEDCGDPLIPDSLRALERTMLLREVESRAAEMTSLRLFSPSGVEAVTIPTRALVIKRVDFDEMLARVAVKAGCGGGAGDGREPRSGRAGSDTDPASRHSAAGADRDRRDGRGHRRHRTRVWRRRARRSGSPAASSPAGRSAE